MCLCAISLWDSDFGMLSFEQIKIASSDYCHVDDRDSSDCWVASFYSSLCRQDRVLPLKGRAEIHIGPDLEKSFLRNDLGPRSPPHAGHTACWEDFTALDIC